MVQSEAEQARAFAGEVAKLIEQFRVDDAPGSEETVDYLTLMRTELLEFADNPADPRVRAGVEEHVKNFIALTAKAQGSAG